MTKDFQTILFSIEDSVATITLNRPDVANGIDPTLADELVQAALICDNDTSVRVVILTGKGRFFCAGGDLKTIGEAAAPKKTMKGMAGDFHKAISIFSRMEKLLIVAINGAAAGGGFSLAMIGDYVISAESAKFSMAYTAAGLSPDGSSTYFLPRMIGIRRTVELMITNRKLTAQEALEWNLVNQVVADEEVQNTALSFAKNIANGAVDAYALVKKLLLCSFDNGLETQMELEGNAIANQTDAANGREGVKAFIEKRKPNFS